MNESEPLPRVLSALERHLRAEHARPDFDLARDLYWDGNRPEEPAAHYLVEVGDRPPGFQCSLCGLRIFSEPSFGDPERNRALRRSHAAELGPLLRGLSTEKQERVIEDFDRGRLAEANLERIEQRAAQATKRPHSREDERRIGACQDFLLDHYRRHGNKERAIEALITLADENPALHKEIAGRKYPYSRETYRGYWRQIPNIERQQAKREWQAAEAARKGARRKLTP